MLSLLKLQIPEETTVIIFKIFPAISPAPTFSFVSHCNSSWETEIRKFGPLLFTRGSSACISVKRFDDEMESIFL